MGKANLLRCLFRHALILRSHPIMNQVLRWPLLCSASVLVALQCSKSVLASVFYKTAQTRSLTAGVPLSCLDFAGTGRLNPNVRTVRDNRCTLCQDGPNRVPDHCYLPDEVLALSVAMQNK